jgi:hypothetical protein
MVRDGDLIRADRVGAVDLQAYDSDAAAYVMALFLDTGIEGRDSGWRRLVACDKSDGPRAMLGFISALARSIDDTRSFVIIYPRVVKGGALGWVVSAALPENWEKPRELKILE